MIYIVTPFFKSGGVETLHSLYFYLNKNGIDSRIVLVKTALCSDGFFEKYSSYKADYIWYDDVNFKRDDIAIASEDFIEYISSTRCKKKVIFWLSWVLYTEKVNPDKKKKCFKMFIKALLTFKFKQSNYYLKRFVSCISPYKTLKRYYHITNSYYITDCLAKQGINSVPAIRPLGIDFLEKAKTFNFSNLSKKENIILFNQKRKQPIVDELMSKLPQYHFYPMNNLSLDDLCSIMAKSKLYIDFGGFPGPERLPRESSLFGCAILVGKEGAATLFEDLPLGDEYKISKPYDIDFLSKKIKEMMNNYLSIVSDFSTIRVDTIGLAYKFENTICNYFKELINGKR